MVIGQSDKNLCEGGAKEYSVRCSEAETEMVRVRSGINRMAS